MTDETTTTPAPAPAPAAPATPDPAPSAEQQIENIMKFDPFGPEEPKGDNGGEAAPNVTDKKVEGGDGSSKPAAQPQEPKPPESPTANPAMDLLKKQVKEATEALEAMKKATAAQPPKPEAEPKGEQEPDTTPPYVFNIPDELVGKLQSDDPREVKDGLVHYTAGVARAIHQTVQKQMMETIGNQIAPAIVRLAVDHIKEQVQTSQETLNIRNDFYGTYKEFDKPELYPVVVAVANSLAQELNVPGYSPEFRDALAQRLRMIVGQPGAQAPPAAPRQPPMMGGSGARAPVTLEKQIQSEIMDLM